MKRQILTFILFITVISVSGQDTIIDKINRKWPVYITNIISDRVTFIMVNDSTHKKKKVDKKNLKKIILDEAPVGSNLITLICEDKNGLPLLISFGKLLQSRGFSFEKVDKDFLIIETKMTKIKKEYNVKIVVSGDENKLLIRSYGVGDMKGIGLFGYGSVSERENYNFRGVKKRGHTSFPAFDFDYTEFLVKEFAGMNDCKIKYISE